MQCQTLDDTITVVDAIMSYNLDSISKNDLLVYFDILSRAWRQVLGDRKGVSTTMDLETSFFDLGGDIIGLVQVASLLEQEGIKLRLEQLVDHPVMLEQLALLAGQKAPETETVNSDEMVEQEQEQIVSRKQGGYKKIWDKSIKKLAKKMQQPKVKGTVLKMEG
jgi:hypothetical protein